MSSLVLLERVKSMRHLFLELKECSRQEFQVLVLTEPFLQKCACLGSSNILFIPMNNF